MSDTDPPPTRRLCPACGYTSEGREWCKVCDGTGLATPDQIIAWSARQRARATSSSTRSVPLQAREALADLWRRGARAQTRELIRKGEERLERFQRDPGDPVAAHELVEWLTGVQAYLRGER